MGFSASAGVSCLFPPSTCQITGTRTGSREGETRWSLADRDYLAHPGYGRWSDSLPQAAETAAATDIELAESVYPQANPALALVGSRRLLLWSHDRPEEPLVSAQELHWSSSSGSGENWQTPISITHDSHADFNRQVAVIGGGCVECGRNPHTAHHRHCDGHFHNGHEHQPSPGRQAAVAGLSTGDD